MDKRLVPVAKKLHAFAEALPEAWNDTPWENDLVTKVGKKIFVFWGESADQKHFGLSVKLPLSADEVLASEDASPTGYGLGRSGWVSINVHASPKPDVDALCDWIEESYRAVAPKKLIKQLDAE